MPENKTSSKKKLHLNSNLQLSYHRPYTKSFPDSYVDIPEHYSFWNKNVLYTSWAKFRVYLCTNTFHIVSHYNFEPIIYSKNFHAPKQHNKRELKKKEFCTQKYESKQKFPRKQKLQNYTFSDKFDMFRKGANFRVFRQCWLFCKHATHTTHIMIIPSFSGELLHTRGFPKIVPSNL